MRIQIFQPSGFCAKCKATKLQLDKLGLEYDVTTADDETIERLKGEGHSVFPVVVVEFGDGVTLQWSDLRLDRIHELAQLAA